MTPLQKLIIDRPLHDLQRGEIIAIKPESDKSITYWIRPLNAHFGGYKQARRTITINSKEIESGKVKIIKHDN